MTRRLLVLGVLLALSAGAWAIIDFKFTPKHLVEQSELIVAGKLAAGAKATEWKIGGGSVLQGKADKDLVLDLSECNKDHAADIQKAFKDNTDAPIVLYAGNMEGREQAFAHIAGMWLRVKKGADGKWLVTGYAPERSGTLAGGTDKLIAMTRYLIDDTEGAAGVPVSAEVRWLEHAKLGAVKGEIAGLAGVEIGGRDSVCLFAGADSGDRLFARKGEESLEEITPKSKLDTKSKRFTWVDLNADGLGDLVSYDGQSLLVRLNSKEGTFTDAGAGFTHKLQAECIGLAPCSANDGKPGVLVSTHAGPLLLAAGEKGWTVVKLPDAPAGGGNLGQPSACIVADFDRDGCADILQPAEQGSLLWKGKPGGFAEPVKSNIATLAGAARTALGDFDEDGYLDVFVAGASRNSMWENNGKGEFTEVFSKSGSLSYKGQTAGANDVQAVDLNHDGRVDICLIYQTVDILYHFNRGFRCFGEEGEVRLPGLDAAPGQPRLGQKAMAVGDFNKDGSLDLAVVLTNGDLYVYFNDKMSMPGINFRLPKGVVGPVTAACTFGEKNPAHTGVAVVYGSSPAVYQPIRLPGTITVKYRYPGKAEQTVQVKVEDKAKDVVLENK